METSDIPLSESWRLRFRAPLLAVTLALGSAQQMAWSQEATKAAAALLTSTEAPKSYAQMLQNAESGDAAAMRAVGKALIQGSEVKKDVAAAQEWLTKAAAVGSGEAAHAMADLFYFGIEIEQDYARSFEWYRRADALGYKHSSYRLAEHYLRGWGTQRNATAAYARYLALAEEDNATAANQVGVLLMSGDGVERDIEKAVAWFRKGAELGFPQAQSNFAFALMTGQGIAPDPLKAMEWYKKAAEADNISALGNLGVAYIEGKLGVQDDAKGAGYIKRAAELLDPAARALFAFLQWQGRGVSKNRPAAIADLEALLLEGNPMVPDILGRALIASGPHQDLPRARAMLAVNAQGGSTEAQAYHGALCLAGLGGPPDIERAMIDLTKASELGHSYASFILAGAWLGYQRPGAVQDTKVAHRLLDQLRVDKRVQHLAPDLKQLAHGTDPLAVYGGYALPAMPAPATEGQPGAKRELPDRGVPAVTYLARPGYPPLHRWLGIEAEVVVDFIVNEEGSVKNAKAVKASVPGFDEAAVAAVQQWRFQPAVRNGRAVATHMQVPVVFTLND